MEVVEHEELVPLDYTFDLGHFLVGGGLGFIGDQVRVVVLGI